MARSGKKQFLKAPAKEETPRLESENDYLEKADEFERSARKWKASDAERALRSYQRAIDTYDEGLKKYPKNFDLAYNKALLLYHITQEKRIAPHLGPLIDFLKEALDAHRFALSIDQENADVLFNTAQVLTSFAEELSEDALSEEDIKTRAVPLLQEAVEMFASCLTRQEMEFTEMRELENVSADQPQMDAEEQAPAQQSSSATIDAPEEWATVVEPVTPSTLIETALAQLGSLSSLASVAAPTESSVLANISEIATPIIRQKLPSYISLLPTSVPEEQKTSAAFLTVSASTSTFHAEQPQAPTNPQAIAQAEADLAVAVFTSALAGAEYLSNLSTADTYYDRVTSAFNPLVKKDDYPQSVVVQICSAYTDALTEFAESVESITEPESSTTATPRWAALNMAQELLTAAISKYPSAAAMGESELPSKAQIYLQRGDIELLRWRITQLPHFPAALARSGPTLVKNAGVYYRGANGLAKQDGDKEIETEAGIKAGVVKLLEGTLDGGVMLGAESTFEGMDAGAVREVVSDMVDDGFIDEEIQNFILKASGSAT